MQARARDIIGRLLNCLLRLWLRALAFPLCLTPPHPHPAAVRLLVRIRPAHASTDCGATNYLRLRDPIRCRECGYRILYKARTTKVVQFEAR